MGGARGCRDQHAIGCLANVTFVAQGAEDGDLCNGSPRTNLIRTVVSYEESRYM